MTNWKFVLNPGAEALEFDEPEGWDTSNIKIVRDNVSNGISVAFSENDITLSGAAARLVKAAYEKDSIDADVKIQISYSCDSEILMEEEFQLDFGTYDDFASEPCSVKIGFNEQSCFLAFKNGYDKKVDLDATTTFEGGVVKELEFLKNRTLLPAKGYLKSSEAYIAEEGDITPFTLDTNTNTVFHFRPTFSNVKYESISTSQLSNPSVGFTFSTGEVGLTDLVSPILLYEENQKCSDGKLDIDIRFKGKIKITPHGSEVDFNAFKARIVKTRDTYRLTDDDPGLELLANAQFSSPTLQVFGYTEIPFDISYSAIQKSFKEGDTIFMFVTGVGSSLNGAADLVFQFDKESYVKLSEKVVCQSTEADLFFPLETIQRIADVTSNGCLEVKSEYYGRISVGYSQDGCGSGRALTNGLFIRNAPEAKFFITPKEFLEGLKPIDAIGWAFEKDGVNEILRVESIGHFYKDEEILRLDNVPGVSIQTEAAKVAGTVKIGYDNWQVESINGLDEFNSTREFRSTVKNATGVYPLTTPIIASGYVIETVRDENFAESGAADTKYDNNIFTIQLNNALQVEQGADSIANVFDPATAYNFRIRPINMLMKWWGYLSGLTFRNTNAPNSKFIFTSGTGNYLAAGVAHGDECTPELVDVAENQDINEVVLKKSYRNKQIVRAEKVTFEAYLSPFDFIKIRNNPYGYISYQCGVNEWRKGFINSITFKAKNSKASFELQNKYE